MTSQVDVLIIGSGFSGIGMGVQLKRAGFDSFLILERGPDVGGTWRDNTYPGCACDVPSHLYSFSYEKNAAWTRMYPTQAEIWSYLRDITAKHGLRPSMRFDTEVIEAVFDERDGRWRVTTRRGDVVSAKVLTSCMGGLSRPQLPAIPGIDRFRGPSFHSAQWDHSVDLTGKRVAVVGTGASAIQFVPQIVPRVARLHLFQRTPPWILPKPDRPLRAWERALFRSLPASMWAFRNFIYWRHELLGIGYTLKPHYLAVAERIALGYLQKTVGDPALRAKLTPSYRIGCKRVLLTSDYLPSLTQPNVELVTDAISEVRERSIATADGVEREVDAIVYGTGFRTLDFTSPVRFVGPGGVELSNVWKTRPAAYLGVATAGFPNLFFITGPNSRLANNSTLFMIETQIDYVVECLRHMRATGAATMSVRRDAQEKFNAALTARFKRTVFATGCKSAYLDENGESPVVWPGFSSEFWWQARRIRLGDFVVTEASRASPR
jgi:cation diffusion facilitator CzcD-associated flavoprotein CzcO